MQFNATRMLSILCFLMLVTTANAQETNVQPDKNPEFPGGMQAMMNYLGSNIKYPETARNAKAEGTVFIRFDVGVDGVLSNLNTINKGPALHPDLVLEAIRVIRSMPVWTPAEKDGKKVKSEMVLPVKFKLQ